ESVNGVGMERVSIWVCVEDDHGSRRVGGRLERVEIAQIESLVAERRTEAESSKMIRHFLLPFVIEAFEPLANDYEHIELEGIRQRVLKCFCIRHLRPVIRPGHLPRR